jgi:rhamnosyltransferase
VLIGAVIVTYNPQIKVLKGLIARITDSVKTVVLSDNGSKNISEIKALVVGFYNATILELGDNMGIGYAQNRGIELVFADKNIGGVLLFDHDSHPSPDMVTILGNAYEKMVKDGIKVGALGPVYMDPRTENNYPVSVFSGFSLIKKYPIPGDNTPIAASFLIASGSLIPRTTYEKVGGMREDFFIDYIDIEWSFRATYNGLPSYVIPNARMLHIVGDDRMKMLGREISIHSPLRRYYLARNSVFMVKTGYIDWRYKVREVFYSITRVVVFLFFVDKKMTYLRYIMKGWGDGFKGKYGKIDSRFLNKIKYA